VTPERMTKAVALRNAKAVGFRPRSIIDIGFAVGTAGLFDIFEDVAHLLIEPLSEAEPVMKKFCAERANSRYVIAAASDHENGMDFAVKPGLTGSSAHVKSFNKAEKRRVPTVLLDRVAADLAGPILLKIDVEGHELSVLRGALETLKKTELIVCEVNTWSDDNPQGRASLMDVFHFMDERGFSLYDFVDIAYRPRDGALLVFDALFARKDSVLRANKGHKTEEQWAASRARKEAKIAKALGRAG